jgi:predicted NBD/HSP70 family sugar kinase
MAHYLGVGIAMLIMGLAPDVVMIFGEVTEAWDRVGPIIQDAVQKRVPLRSQTRILPTDATQQPRLRGTISLALQKYFGAPLIA